MLSKTWSRKCRVLVLIEEVLQTFVIYNLETKAILSNVPPIFRGPKIFRKLKKLPFGSCFTRTTNMKSKEIIRLKKQTENWSRDGKKTGVAKSTVWCPQPPDLRQSLPKIFIQELEFNDLFIIMSLCPNTFEPLKMAIQKCYWSDDDDLLITVTILNILNICLLRTWDQLSCGPKAT